MTPLTIMNDEIQTKCRALKTYHANFRNALFRPEATASQLHKDFNISPQIRVHSAKQLALRTIEDIRYLRRIKERMQDVARIQRTASRRKEVR